MPRIDFLLITHDHFDRLDYPTILALEPLVDRVVTGLGVGAQEIAAACRCSSSRMPSAI